jgi:hypothetical protein
MFDILPENLGTPTEITQSHGNIQSLTTGKNRFFHFFHSKSMSQQACIYIYTSFLSLTHIVKT